jgi:hypothetical protein
MQTFWDSQRTGKVSSILLGVSPEDHNAKIQYNKAFSTSFFVLESFNTSFKKVKEI